MAADASAGQALTGTCVREVDCFYIMTVGIL